MDTARQQCEEWMAGFTKRNGFMCEKLKWMKISFSCYFVISALSAPPEHIIVPPSGAHSRAMWMMGGLPSALKSLLSLESC